MTRDTDTGRSLALAIRSVSRSQVRALLLTFVLVMSIAAMPFLGGLDSGVAAAANGSVVFDDFEDGNLDEWDGGSDQWSIVNNSSYGVGDYSMQADTTGSPTTQRSINSSGYNSVSYDQRVDSFSDSNVVSVEGPGVEFTSGTSPIISIVTADGTDDLAEGEVAYENASGDYVSAGMSINTSEWYTFRAENIDYQSGTYDIRVHQSGEEVGFYQGATFANSASQLDTILVRAIDGVQSWDRFKANHSYPPTAPVTGQVTDQDGNAISGATVTFTNASTDAETTTQTDSSGDFEIGVGSGTYEVEISADGYQTFRENRDVVSGEDLGTFQLAPQQLDLQFTRFLEPGDSTPYTVEFTGENGTVMDVTGEVSINSSNTSIATVDTAEVEIVGAQGVNGTAEITANYTVGNETYTDTRTITVATKTVDNLEIIPGTWRLSALLDDITIQVILVAIGAGIIATRAASSWAGLGAMELVILIGWFGGWVPLGIALLGLFTALFIGLNLAANIDYSVRR